MSTAEKIDDPAPERQLKWVGTRPRRPDGVDKVTGRAHYGADHHLPAMLIGRMLRSAHPHARIKSIDTSKAEALDGVKAVVTREDFGEMPAEPIAAGEMMINYHNLVRNVMAREKALYDGHAVAAVAATSATIARKALSLIAVDYEPLPHVIDVDAAMAPGAPILHESLFTQGVEPKAETPSNVSKRIEVATGDTDAGFAEADVVVERAFKTKPVHQGYIEPHACVASFSEDGLAELWCTTQGQHVTRSYCATLLGMEVSKLRVTPSEIGGGFGGKTVVFIEPVAMLLSRKSGRPVKIVMTREEVFRASGPTSSADIWVKVGATKDGQITAGEAVLKFDAGAFPGASPVEPGANCAFAPYDIANVKVVGYDVVMNRPQVAAYRAPGAPISEYAVESAIDELAKRLDIDPIELRLKNSAKEGTRAAYGPRFGQIGFVDTLQAAKAHPHYSAPLGANQGRGVASGFWFNIGGGETCASLNVNSDGTLTLILGTPDIGGSRASVTMMAAEELGIEPDRIRPIIADTSALGFTFLTGGSRVTFASGMAAVEAARAAIGVLRERAAKIWCIEVDAVVWEDGCAKPAGANAGEFEPLTLADIAKVAGKTGGAISGHAEIDAQGAGPSLGVHLVDVEVDPETGAVKVVRYTVVQDAGRAIHPSYVEGQFQGGAVQCIGWALNEEYIYGADGRLENPGFLDYRIPVASDLPMIDTVIVEVPNPKHPYGVRGVGETPIVPGLAAIANAVEDATGVRYVELPMSPPKVLKGIEDAANGGG